MGVTNRWLARALGEMGAAHERLHGHPYTVAHDGGCLVCQRLDAETVRDEAAADPEVARWEDDGGGTHDD